MEWETNKTGGYSLLEVLIALALAGVVTAAVAFSFQQSFHLQKTLDGRITATVLGMSKLAELEAGSEAVSSGEFSPPYTRYRWNAREEKMEGGFKAVILTIEWSGGDRYSHHQVFKGFPREP